MQIILLIPDNYSTILIISGILDLYICYMAWKRRATPGSRVLMLLMFSIAFWSFGASIARSVPEIDEKIIWAKITYIGAVSTPPMILLFSLAYTRTNRWLNKKTYWLISILPLATLLLVFTNERHLLFWSQLSIFHDVSVIIYHHGPWFYIYTVFSYIVIILATIVFLRATFQKKYIRPSQAITMTIGLLLPWAANLIYVLDIDPLRGLDLTPVAFTITALTMMLNISRLNLLDLMPIAREKVVDSMQDCLLVIDQKGRIVDVNPAMQQCISNIQNTKEPISKSQIIGFPVQEVIKNCPKLVSSVHSDAMEQLELELTTEDSISYYDMESTPFFDKKQNLVGKMILLNDITSYKQAVQSEAEAKDLAEALLEASSALSSTLDIDELMKSIMTHINKVLSFDFASVMLLDNERLLVTACSGLQQPEDFTGKTYLINEHPNYEVLNKKNTIIYQDILQDFPQHELSSLYNVRSYISAPVFSLNVIIGFLNLASYQTNHFTEKDKLKINAFASQAAVALENARLYTETQRQLVQQMILNEISLSTSSKLNLTDFLENVHRQINQYVHVENFFVTRYDEKTDDWEFIYARDYAKNLTAGLHFKFEDGLTGHVIQTGTALWLNNTKEISEFIKKTDRQPLIQSVKSWMGVPLKVGENIMGAMVSYHHEIENYFTQHDFNFFIMVSSQIAIAFENAYLFAKMEKMAITDTLTGLYNRRHFLWLAGHEMERSLRYHIPLSLIMLDIDHFKKVNDNYGHSAGDEVLQMIAGICRKSLRKIDIIGRYGGEEFVILLPETPTRNALEVAERLRMDIKQSKIEVNQTDIQVTASMGISSQTADFQTPFPILLDQADQAMYSAKQDGRDQIKLYQSN